jgi:DNA-binding FrmR family transcriptional regulator
MPASQETTAAEQRRIVNRLRRLGGQVRGLATMVSNDKACEDVLTQVMAAKSALNQVGLRVIAYTVKTCRTSVDDSPMLVVDESLALFLAYARTGPLDVAAQVTAPAGSERGVTEVLLARLGGRVSELESMVESDEGCDDVLEAALDAKRLLDQVGLQVVAHAMRTCLGPRPGATRDQVVDEAMEVFIKYIGCVR